MREQRICKHCGETFTVTIRPNRPGLFCSPACAQAASLGKPKKAQVKGARYTYRPEHPLAPGSGLIPVARLVLYERIGPGPHLCNWCGITVDWMPGKGLAKGALIADHLNHDSEDNRPENLVPACNSCNAHRTRKGDRRLILDEEVMFVRPDGRRERGVDVVCQMCGNAFVTTQQTLNIGRGKYCSRVCANAHRSYKAKSEHQ